MIGNKIRKSLIFQLIIYLIIFSFATLFFIPEIFPLKNGIPTCMTKGITFYVFSIVNAILLSIGIFLIFWTRNIARDKTTKKLGYGPLYFQRRFIWPREYYSVYWKYEIKPQYKNEIEKWNKEYSKYIKEHCFYRILGILLFLVGLIATIFRGQLCNIFYNLL